MIDKAPDKTIVEAYAACEEAGGTLDDVKQLMWESCGGRGKYDPKFGRACYERAKYLRQKGISVAKITTRVNGIAKDLPMREEASGEDANE